MFKTSAKSSAITRMRSRTRKAKKLIFSYGTILFMIFSVFSVASLYLMRENILSNSNALGHEVAQRLDSSLQFEFQKQCQFVELLAHYADVFLKDHANDPDGGAVAFDLWMKQTEEELRKKQTDMRIDIYASINGHIVSPTYWDGDAFLVTEARPWYKAAMTADRGRAVILDPYTDIFTNTVITTVSARIGDTDDVIAIDLYLESVSQSSTFASLVPDNYCFYLVDAKGTVILYYTPFNANYAQIQRHVNTFFDKLVLNRSYNDEPLELITDLIGEKRNIFTTYNPSTGWYTIATTLYSDVLFNYHMISNLFLLMVVSFIIIEVWMVWREYHLSSQIETTNEALKVLGNSYQIILRVNFKMGTFTTLKAPDMMRLRLASHNSFDDLISVFSDFVLPESWNNFYKNFSLNHLRNLASLSIRDFGHDYQLKLNNENRYRWFNARILFDESLDLDESIICFKLIDEEKITELEEHQLLTDALESAKKNEESKNVFFANMSHDMRTPLNGIIGLCQIGMNHLKRSDVEMLPDVFKKMTTASHQLLALVDDILEVARPQMESKLTLAPFNIIHEVKENIDVFKVNAQQQGKKVNLYFDVTHQVVIGDAAKIRQILNNLVSNSLKYSHPGCVVNVHIREMTHLHKPSFMIEVSDTGIGMDKEFLKKLFNPYVREQRLTSVQGTGLGMSIVKNVVNIMGGDIKVKSAINVGTTFTINLPLRLADDETAQEVQQQLQERRGDDSSLFNENEETPATPTPAAPDPVAESEDKKPKSKDLAQEFMDNFTMEGLNLLIVEDNQLNMEIACDILGMKGVKLTCAWDGMQAVDIFTLNPEYTFDAILMDMRMPKMDGCEASSTIRASGRADAKTIPIIACTANAFSEDIAATQNAGMNAHVSKPLDFTVLEHVLAKVISNRADLKEFYEHRKHNAPAQSTSPQSAPAPQTAPTDEPMNEPQNESQAQSVAQDAPLDATQSKEPAATILDPSKLESTKLEPNKLEPNKLEPSAPEPQATEDKSEPQNVAATKQQAAATPVAETVTEASAEQAGPAATATEASNAVATSSKAVATQSTELPTEAQPHLAAEPEAKAPAASKAPSEYDLQDAPEKPELNLELHDAAEISVSAEDFSTKRAQAAPSSTPMSTATTSGLREELADSSEQLAKTNKLGGYFAKRPKRSTISVRSELDRVASELRNSSK